MSEYQARKALALEQQRKKDEALRRELEAKKLKEKQQAHDEEERKKKRDEGAREARRLELLKANAALNTAEQAATKPSAAAVEWNPFAEDEKSAVPSPTLTAQRKPTLKPVQRGSIEANEKAPSSKRTNGGYQKVRTVGALDSGAGPSRDRPKKNAASPPPLGRKEKAARAFAEAAKKSAKENPYSIGSLLKSQGTGSTGDTTPKKSSPEPSKIKTQKTSSIAPKALPRPVSTAKVGESSKSKLPPTDTPTPPIGNLSKPKRAKLPPIPTSARIARPASSPDTETSDSNPGSDPPTAKRRRRGDELDRNAAAEKFDYSAEIQAMFRRPGAAAPRRYANSDEGSSDMEAGLSDVEEEESRAAKIARREDMLAEQEEAERRRRKEEIKRQRDKGR